MRGSSTAWAAFAVALSLSALQPAAAQSGVSIGPRVWFLYDNFLQRDTKLEDGETVLNEVETGNFSTTRGESPQTNITLIGGAFAVPTGLRNTQLIITALTGETEEETQFVSSAGTFTVDDTPGSSFATFDLATFNLVAVDDIRRTDVEVFLRRNFNSGDRLTVSALGGVRYERTDIDRRQSGVIFASNTPLDLSVPGFLEPDLPGLLAIGTSNSTSEATRDFYSVRGGAGLFAPVNDAHGFFIDGQLTVGHLVRSRVELNGVVTLATVSGVSTSERTTVQEGEESTLFGPDLTVGYRWNILDRIGFDVRYRTQALYFISGERRSIEDDPRVSHGLSLGLSYTF